MTEATPKKTFHGSCHCKKVTYTVDIALPLQVARCNCTVCTKTGFTSYQTPKSNFKLLTPASFAELTNYQPNMKTMNRYSCPTCSVQIALDGTYPLPGGKEHVHFSINAATLDQPQEGLELTGTKIVYVNGREDKWTDGLTDAPVHSAFA